jgi:hypothetical protein
MVQIGDSQQARVTTALDLVQLSIFSHRPAPAAITTAATRRHGAPKWCLTR